MDEATVATTDGTAVVTAECWARLLQITSRRSSERFHARVEEAESGIMQDQMQKPTIAHYTQQCSTEALYRIGNLEHLVGHRPCGGHRSLSHCMHAGHHYTFNNQNEMRIRAS